MKKFLIPTLLLLIVYLTACRSANKSEASILQSSVATSPETQSQSSVATSPETQSQASNNEESENSLDDILPDNYFNDDMTSVIPNNPVKITFLNSKISPSSQKETVITDASEIKEFLDTAVSQNWKRLDGSWRIKTNPDIPYYSAAVSGDSELVINFGGRLGNLGFIALPGSEKTVLYEVPGEIYDKMVTIIERF